MGVDEPNPAKEYWHAVWILAMTFTAPIWIPPRWVWLRVRKHRDGR